MKMEWTNVLEKMPEIYDYVLVYAEMKGTNEPCPIAIARSTTTEWEFINQQPLIPNVGAYMDMEYEMEGDDISHWMPLPKPPKKKLGEKGLP